MEKMKKKGERDSRRLRTRLRKRERERTVEAHYIVSCVAGGTFFLSFSLSLFPSDFIYSSCPFLAWGRERERVSSGENFFCLAATSFTRCWEKEKRDFSVILFPSFRALYHAWSYPKNANPLSLSPTALFSSLFKGAIPSVATQRQIPNA